MIHPALLLSLSQAKNSVTLPSPRPLEIRQALQDKNFYFLSLIQRDREAAQLIANDPELTKLADAKRSALKTAFNKVQFGNVAQISGLLWTQEEIAAVGMRLGRLDLTRLVKSLRLSGVAQCYANLSDRDLILKVWEEAALGCNRIIEVYGLQSVGSRSTAIDSPLYLIKNPLFGGMVKNLCGVQDEGYESRPTFFQPTLDLAVRLLDVQLRDESGRHEPMELSVNRLAYRRAKSLNFEKYRYSSMLLPGYGPEEAQVALSPIGKLALELAARRYKKGLAPFIIVSGGYVHPSMTPYSEAIEMKKSLMKDFGIPEDAIIVDPHARHTTTNIRNAARLIFRYGLPMQKPCLIVTNTYQRFDIESAAFARRCQGVFGYLPALKYTHVSEFDVAFLPNIESLSIDPLDPLDP